MERRVGIKPSKMLSSHLDASLKKMDSNRYSRRPLFLTSVPKRLKEKHWSSVGSMRTGLVHRNPSMVS